MSIESAAASVTRPLEYLAGALNSDEVGEDAAALRLIRSAVSIPPTRMDVYLVRNEWGPGLGADDLRWVAGHARACSESLDLRRAVLMPVAFSAVVIAVILMSSLSVLGVVLGLGVLGVAAAAGFAWRAGMRAPHARTWADLLERAAADALDREARESLELPSSL